MTLTPKTRKRLSLYFICNCAFLIVMVAAGLFIRSGQAAYTPYTDIDKQFVRTVIASGDTEKAWEALKTTEIARAEGFKGMVSMMDLMLIATLIMALFFVVNGYLLFRLRGENGPQRVPVMVRS